MSLANFAQTFLIHKDTVQGADVIFITSIDLNFAFIPDPNSLEASGADTPAVTVSLVETDVDQSGNYVPNLNKRLFGAIRTKTHNVITANTFTNFKFDNPIPVKPDTVYGIVVNFVPDAAFKLNIKTSGSANTSSQGLTAYQEGKLFTISDGGFLLPLNDKDLSFRVYIAKFDTAKNGVELEILNDQLEFLNIKNVVASDANSPFFGDEYIVDANATSFPVLSGTLSVNANTNIINGTSTSFNTDFAPGDKILITDSNVIVSSVNKCIRVVNSVANSTQLFVDVGPNFTNSTAYAFKVPCGKAFNFIPANNNLILWDSNAANSVFKFTSNSFLVAIESDTTAIVNSVFDYHVNKFNADFHLVVPKSTNVAIRVSLANTGYAWTENNFVKSIAGSNNEFAEFDGIIASRSNEIAHTGTLYDPGVSASTKFRYKSMVARVQMNTDNQYSSPYFNLDVANLLLWSNFINNDLTGETGRYGNCASKAVSKVITLADGLDAEDVRIFVTCAKPAGTDIAVYAKIANKADLGSFDEHLWTPLVLKNTISAGQITGDLSPTGVPQDTVELEYGFSTTLDDHGDLLNDATTGEQVFATVQTGNNVVLISSTNTTPSIAANDVVGIYHPAFPSIHFIAVVNSVINSTAVTLNLPGPTGAGLIASGDFIYKVQSEYALSAFNNILNGNVVRYFSKSNFGVFDTFLSFSYKIDLLSDDIVVAPIVLDSRAVAVSA